jgi:hypothetical protein
VTQYERTQIGCAMIYVLFVASVALAITAIFEPSPHREISLIISALFLVTVPLFYKLTITRACHARLKADERASLPRFDSAKRKILRTGAIALCIRCTLTKSDRAKIVAALI